MVPWCFFFFLFETHRLRQIFWLLLFHSVRTLIQFHRGILVLVRIKCFRIACSHSLLIQYVYRQQSSQQSSQNDDDECCLLYNIRNTGAKLHFFFFFELLQQQHQNIRGVQYEHMESANCVCSSKHTSKGNMFKVLRKI